MIAPTDQNTVGRVKPDERGRITLKRWIHPDQEFIVHTDGLNVLLRAVV